jgi:hypothetical protein
MGLQRASSPLGRCANAVTEQAGFALPARDIGERLFCIDNQAMQDVDTSPEPTPSEPQSETAPTAREAQPRNPLHGLTLETIVTRLADFYGWDDLGQRIPIRCFTHDPSVGSSLKFLRKTPWAREKVEGLYLFMLRDQKRQGF